MKEGDPVYCYTQNLKGGKCLGIKGTVRNMERKQKEEGDKKE